MMECNDHTAKVARNNGNGLASLIYYEGDATNKITNGRGSTDMDWGGLNSVVEIEEMEQIDHN
jgi:hypothetical protein